MTISGDLGKLTALANRLGSLDADSLEAISVTLADETIAMIMEGFRAESDPYSKRWTPKLVADGRKTLSGPTSRLKNNWHRAEASKTGFRVQSGVIYALPHQAPQKRADGRLKRPKRMMVPELARGLPRAWSDRYREAASEAIQEILG